MKGIFQIASRRSTPRCSATIPNLDASWVLVSRTKGMISSILSLSGFSSSNSNSNSSTRSSMRSFSSVEVISRLIFS
ncbi:hypothetical protein HLASF_3055 (plasmid) [Halanaeroarchaeum sulfurireducens]|uniref:Uncharacterized protein n=1 Tax=Halanaeroarchaeum sulfurireducens TaxID=1604004 RepID=A0A0F7PC04_9EURY|nr:hypothetical protein HLASF_3055 [Halanaeroarchaeum sulfurireducens]ALG83124.1 hypothetical protein HLASA_3056 [Halanaeroarchaeum sulfurireducens]